MLAEHVVDVDIGADRAVLLEMTDIDHRVAADVEHQPQLARPDQRDRIADHRIFRNAALETRQHAAAVLDLSDQVELRHRLVTMLRRQRPDRDVGDDADQQRFSGVHAEEIADGGAGLVAAGNRCGRQPDAGLRAAH
jgi:hypothetical protein